MKSISKKGKTNERGAAALTLVIVTMIVIAIVTYASLQSISSMQRTFASLYISSKSATASLRTNLLALLRHPATWSAVVDANSSLACVKDGTPCPLTQGEIQVIKVEDVELLDTSDTQQGFSLGGETCMTYNDSSDFNCVFRPRIQWEPICTAPCVNPAIRFLIDLRPKAEFLQAYNLNPNNFKFMETK